MNTIKEPRLLIQASYQAEADLLAQLINVCKANDLALSHLHQREIMDWYVIDLEVTGLWHQLVKLEVLLADWAEQLTEGHLFWQRMNAIEDDIIYLPYIVQVQTIVSIDVVAVLTEFFNIKNVKLKEVVLECYVQSKTGVPMQNLTLNIYLPVNINLPELRENLIILCEQYNFDVIFEQDRG